MDDFTGQLDPSVFSTERDVVKNERRARFEGQPLDRVVLDLYERLFEQFVRAYQQNRPIFEALNSERT